MTSPQLALVRPPPRSYAGYYANHGVTVDVAELERQHAEYVAALRASGLAIESIAPDESLPDCVFVEDTAVAWDDRALVARMTPHREGEQVAVVERLGRDHTIVRLPPGATLDGGDVLHADAVTYVGRSRRTNAAGARALREFLSPRPVIEIPVERCLHLKSAATWLGDGTLLAAADLVDIPAFDARRVVLTAAGESKAANTIRIGAHLLALDGYPRTADALVRFATGSGIALVRLRMSEFEKGDGSLTCLSILIANSVCA